MCDVVGLFSNKQLQQRQQQLQQLLLTFDAALHNYYESISII